MENQSWILHFVKDWDTKWTLWIPFIELNVIQYFHECWSSVPVACLFWNTFSNVVALETGDWHEHQVFLRVASLLEEWQKTLLDFIETSLFPIAVIHLVHNNNKSLNS